MQKYNKTPLEKAYNSSAKYVSYEPVIDLNASSPLRTQGNLTGLPRKLKDLAADWYNARIKWNNMCKDGFKICNIIGNMKIESFDEDVSLPSSLLPHCDQLQDVILTLEAIIAKMSRWTESVHGISELLASQGRAEEIIFQTWTIKEFLDKSVQLYDMYEKEYNLKKDIYENICHCKDRSEAMFMLALWSHEPYIEEDITLNIDAMTIETGHS